MPHLVAYPQNDEEKIRSAFYAAQQSQMEGDKNALGGSSRVGA